MVLPFGFILLAGIRASIQAIPGPKGRRGKSHLLGNASLALLNAADAKHDEVPALAPVSRDMECPDIVADFRPLLHPHDGGAGAQGFQCG